MKPKSTDNDTLIRRAFAAHFRAGGDQPSKTSAIEYHRNRQYVVLREAEASRGILRVYRVRTDGILKGLRRWPVALEQSR